MKRVEMEGDGDRKEKRAREKWSKVGPRGKDGSKGGGRGEKWKGEGRRGREKEKKEERKTST